MGWDLLHTGTLNIDWAIVTSIAALTIAIVAILVVIIENRREKLIFGLKVLLEVNDYFHSGTMLETRQKAAASLLNDSYDDNVENPWTFLRW